MDECFWLGKRRYVQIRENIAQFRSRRRWAKRPEHRPASLSKSILAIGREAWSIAFLSTPGIERLYSEVTNRMPWRTWFRFSNAWWIWPDFVPSSWVLKRQIVDFKLCKRKTSDLASLRLNESLRRLPTGNCNLMFVHDELLSDMFVRVVSSDFS